MEKLKIYLVEDEVIISETICDMLVDLGYEVVGLSVTAEEAIKEIEQIKPDLALLDIGLRGEKDGIWLGKQVRETLSIPFVFLTSFGDKETIMAATSSSPYGYLLKPVEKQNLFACIEVALNKFSEEKSLEKEYDANENASFVNNNFLFVKDEYLYKKVSVFDVWFIKASGNYIEIYTENKKHVIKGTFKKFIDNLPENHFFQSHRSYLVSLRHIENFGMSSIKIQNHVIPLVKNQKEELQRILKTYSFLG